MCTCGINYIFKCSDSFLQMRRADGIIVIQYQQCSWRPPGEDRFLWPSTFAFQTQMFYNPSNWFVQAQKPNSTALNFMLMLCGEKSVLNFCDEFCSIFGQICVSKFVMFALLGVTSDWAWTETLGCHLDQHTSKMQNTLLYLICWLLRNCKIVQFSVEQVDVNEVASEKTPKVKTSQACWHRCPERKHAHCQELQLNCRLTAPCCSHLAGALDTHRCPWSMLCLSASPVFQSKGIFFFERLLNTQKEIQNNLTCSLSSEKFAAVESPDNFGRFAVIFLWRLVYSWPM